jgi:hypothetical protein
MKRVIKGPIMPLEDWPSLNTDQLLRALLLNEDIPNGLVDQRWNDWIDLESIAHHI